MCFDLVIRMPKQPAQRQKRIWDLSDPHGRYMTNVFLTREKHSGCYSISCHTNAFARHKLFIVTCGTRRFSENHRKCITNVSIIREKHYRFASICGHTNAFAKRSLYIVRSSTRRLSDIHRKELWKCVHNSKKHY